MPNAAALLNRRPETGIERPGWIEHAFARAEDQPTNDNLVGIATGHRADGGRPRRDFLVIHTVGRAANALILGPV